MKKLLLLLIIPFLSFGQCDDPNACNFELLMYDYNTQNPIPYPNNDCEYTGDPCLAPGPYYMDQGWYSPSEAGWYNDGLFAWNENCECTIYPGCQDENACNFNLYCDELLFWADDGSTTLDGFMSPECVVPGDNCILLGVGDNPYCNDQLGTSLEYSGMLWGSMNGNCECVCVEEALPYNYYNVGQGTITITNCSQIGCADPLACNYDDSAEVSINCDYESCAGEGCTDESACNFENSALIDDGSCIYPDLCGSCDPSSLCDEYTYVPDDGFEKWIEETILGADNGFENDNYVLTSALNCDGHNNVGLTDGPGCYLNISNSYYPIFDLTGIEDFKISWLNLGETFISTLDLSNVEFMDYQGNYDSKLSFTGSNQYLETIILPEDTIKDIEFYIGYLVNLSDIVFNPNLTFADLYLGYGINNTQLCELVVEGNLISGPNSIPIRSINCDNIISYDFSGLFGALYTTTIEIYPGWSPTHTVTQINLNNDTDFYNWDLNGFNDFYCSPCALSCIEVNSIEAANFYSNNNQWPDWVTYSTNCYNDNLDCSTTNIVEPSNLQRKLIKTVDILGREASNKGFQLHIYDDGSVEKKYLIK